MSQGFWAGMLVLIYDFKVSVWRLNQMVMCYQAKKEKAAKRSQAQGKEKKTTPGLKEKKVKADQAEEDVPQGTLKPKKKKEKTASSRVQSEELEGREEDVSLVRLLELNISCFFESVTLADVEVKGAIHAEQTPKKKATFGR